MCVDVLVCGDVKPWLHGGFVYQRIPLKILDIENEDLTIYTILTYTETYL